jgi:IS605 OrfB family transposase
MLENAYQTNQWFPYSVRLKTKNGKIYAFISVEEKLLPTKIKRDNGIIGIDVNTYPFHLALAFASKDRNLEKYQSISLNDLLNVGSEKRQYLEWQIAHEIIEIAKEENKAIAIENLKKLSKDKRGYGFVKLRGKLQKWSYKRLLNKIEILTKRNEIEIKKVNPAYTSVIGKLKYSQQYNIDKDITGAYVIAKLKKEKNEYNRNKLKGKLAKLRKNLKTLQQHISLLASHVSRLESGKSKLATRQPVNQWKEQVMDSSYTGYKSWQILSIALAFYCLEKSYRDLSPLKRVIISKNWIAVVNRLVSVLGTGTMTLPKYRLLGSEVSEMAEYKYPNPSYARFA